MNSSHVNFNSVYWAGHYQGQLDVYLPVDEVDEHDIVDHGVEHDQYFAGCSLEDYDDMRTGYGGSYNEALFDAIESFEDVARWNCGDLNWIWQSRALYDDDNEKTSVDAYMENCDIEAYDEDKAQYRVTVRVKRKEKPVDMNSYLRLP